MLFENSRPEWFSIFDSEACKVVEELGLDYVGTELATDSGRIVLRLYIDSLEGVNVGDCEKVSKTLSKRLDMLDVIEDSYYLEVSSPGINRILLRRNDIEKFKGGRISVRVKSGGSSRRAKSLNGNLKDVDDDGLLITNSQGDDVKIPWKSFIKANIVADEEV